MKRTSILAAPVALLLLAMPAAAEKLSLNALSTYLNKLVTAQSEFTQINDDGTLATGQMLLRRPGNIRFEYNPPSKSLVIADHGQVAIFDEKSNQPPERFPLNKTPLKLILTKNVNLSSAKMVVGHTSDGPTTTITAQDPKHPEYGNIQLVFTSAPIELRQWIVTDGSGQKTTVILGAMNAGAKVSRLKFNIEQEIRSRGF
jgi:outer membrane lipoprotein-sorting protein